MNDQVTIATQLSIREAGFDEHWLQNQIYENPACLGLGELDALARERRQATGGRLDLLLKSPEDDTMYEVELMLGETDETHIIRTIEYWDNEKRRWPHRQHFAVLVAEHINRRFFNVIHLLSLSIPIIAIQASLLESEGRRNLYFAKVLDTYEEADDGTSLGDNRNYNREYWVKKAEWTLEAAEKLQGITQDILPQPTLNYLRHYVAVNASDYNFFWLHKRRNGKSLLGFRAATPVQEEVTSLLDAKNLSHVRKSKRFYVTVDRQMIEKERETFRAIANIMKKTREPEE